MAEIIDERYGVTDKRYFRKIRIKRGRLHRVKDILKIVERKRDGVFREIYILKSVQYRSCVYADIEYQKLRDGKSHKRNVKDKVFTFRFGNNARFFSRLKPRNFHFLFPE